MDSNFFWNEFYRCRGNTLTMCELHESTCNGFRDILVVYMFPSTFFELPFSLCTL